MSNTAQDILKPSATGILRIVSLYVGQGDATLIIYPDNGDYRYAIVDTNIDTKNQGINIPKFLNDLLDGTNGLEVFINTHPHQDHLEGIEEIHSSTPIKEIWHSGHTPGKKNNEAYQQMQEVVNDIGKENEYFLKGTNVWNKVRDTAEDEDGVIKKLGNIDFIVLAPAEYVVADIEGEDDEKRYNRIHEQCAVLKFQYGSPVPKAVLITGDSDKKAWKDHITQYHNEKLPSEVLRSSHHGSRTFFKDNSNDTDVYEDHIETINPTYIIVSAPKQSESRHNHPHDDAMDLYRKHIDDEANLLHLGQNRECVIIDIDSDGNIDVWTDQELVQEYGYDNDGGEDNSSNSDKEEPVVYPIRPRTSRIDRNPMGNQ